MKTIKWVLLRLIIIAFVAFMLPAMALADTDGSEIQVADQPDRLILQLGSQWAGAEFELKTDAGVFPVPVVVDESGILKMDLGGSKTYILSSLASTTGAAVHQGGAESAEPSAGAASKSGSSTGVPVKQLLIFFVCLAAATSGLFALRYYKQRRDAYYEYDDEDEDYT